MGDLTKDLTDELIDLVDLKKLKAKDLNDIAGTLITAMRQKIKRGFSPISGKRFPAYKNPKRYPGNRKPPTPVNLKLTGKFLRDLRARVKTGKIPKITLFLASKDSRDKERGHRQGANGQPRRPIIPNERENFAPSIIEELDESVEDVLDKRLD